MPSMATAPIAATATKAARQPKACRIAVPPGTPKMLATVRPANISAMARARSSRGTRSAATTAPMPKKAAWEKAVTTRAAIRNP